MRAGTYLGLPVGRNVGQGQDSNQDTKVPYRALDLGLLISSQVRALSATFTYSLGRIQEIKVSRHGRTLISCLGFLPHFFDWPASCPHEVSAPRAGSCLA
jgi:hypothetical protein